MARFGCICGSTLSNSMCPSKNVIYVIKKECAESALAYNSNIKLMDFMTNWDTLTDSKKGFVTEKYDYWYCTECKRVTQCEIHIGGKALSIYKPSDIELSIGLNELSKMEELIIFSNLDEDFETEKNPSITLVGFLKSLSKKRYFMSVDKKFVYAYDSIAGQISLVYQQEML